MEFLAVTLISFFITVLAIPLTIKTAIKLNLVDDPKKRPHPAQLHKHVVPRAGGIALYIGIVATSLLFLPIQKHLIGIIAALTILLAVGIIDDKLKNFNPYLRLLLMFIAAGTAVASGIGISFITNPLANFSDLPYQLGSKFIRLDTIAFPIDFFGPHYIVVLADLFAFIWIVTITQVINWSKGVDGQMPGITLVATLTLGLLSLKLAFQGDQNQLYVAKLAFIVAGASFGFLIFNWAPAKIFPGFSGSTILAFMIATLAILSGAKVATALLALAVPTTDFIYTFFRRIISGRSPVWGDKGHLHHKLLDMGWTSSQISLFYILGSAILGLIALFVDTASKVFAATFVAIVFFGFILWLNSFGGLSKQPGPGNG